MLLLANQTWACLHAPLSPSLSTLLPWKTALMACRLLPHLFAVGSTLQYACVTTTALTYCTGGCTSDTHLLSCLHVLVSTNQVAVDGNQFVLLRRFGWCPVQACTTGPATNNSKVQSRGGSQCISDPVMWLVLLKRVSRKASSTHMRRTNAVLSSQ